MGRISWGGLAGSVGVISWGGVWGGFSRRFTRISQIVLGGLGRSVGVVFGVDQGG